jgi:PleD family two-component response regulator
MASDLVLIVAADRHHADRYAEALLPAGPFAFAFARDSVTALADAASMRPALAIISLAGVEGIELCRGFRRNPKTADVRLLLVLERDQLAAARGTASNGVVVEPTSPLAITGEALNVLRRSERRSLDRSDRRTLPRGGRRMTDVSPTDPASASLAE